jgi:hypothetical protein
MDTTEELQRRIGELEDQLKQRDRRIEKLRHRSQTLPSRNPSRGDGYPRLLDYLVARARKRFPGKSAF